MRLRGRAGERNVQVDPPERAERGAPRDDRFDFLREECSEGFQLLLPDAFERVGRRLDDQDDRDPRKGPGGSGQVDPLPSADVHDDLPGREKNRRTAKTGQRFLASRLVRRLHVREPDRVSAERCERTRRPRPARAGGRRERAEEEDEQPPAKLGASHDDATGASRAAAASGSSNRTRNPPPVRFSAAIVPPCSSTIFLAIARPRPVPPLFAEK